MDSERNDDALRDFYSGIEEGTRLTTREGCVELMRTQSLLRERLRPGQRILDVGGANGVHADWLIGDGHDVDVIDLIPTHVSQARQRGLRAEVGDARALVHDESSFDVVLLLGPLYHLGSAGDRSLALTEAWRVLRPGGLLAAAAISRLAVAVDHLRKRRYDDPGLRRAARSIAELGRDDTGYGTGVFYFHSPTELDAEVAGAGFHEVEVLGVEGPAWSLVPLDARPDDPIVEQVVDIARMADGEPASVAASSHLLAFGVR
ncbi:MAG: class I SAM-dependent methyltransferase [Acidimicrobiales bacterium]